MTSEYSPTEPSIPQKTRPITLTVLLICVIVFFGTVFSIKFSTRASATVYSTLAFDYPKKQELRDELLALFTPEQLSSPQSLPREGKILLAAHYTTPIWQGFYPIVLHKLQNPNEPSPPLAPICEKISQGQLWRIISPCFLHGNILHILFNMAWLLLLGNQMEFFLGKKKYIAFIFVSGALSNLMQYLMSGPNFIGYSGVISAMLGYIYIRQKLSQTEFYSLPPTTFRFISIFILGLAAIETLSFIYEVIYQTEAFGLGIANTAHIGGALIGMALATSKSFTPSNRL